MHLRVHTSSSVKCCDALFMFDFRLFLPYAHEKLYTILLAGLSRRKWSKNIPTIILVVVQLSLFCEFFCCYFLCRHSDPTKFGTSCFMFSFGPLLLFCQVYISIIVCICSHSLNPRTTYIS
jgi:hypothetical protein